MRALYAVTIHQSNWAANRVAVEVHATDAAEAKRKALMLAPKIHSPIVTITGIVEAPP